MRGQIGRQGRGFLSGAGAIVGCTLGRAGIAEAVDARSGRTPTSRKDRDAIIRGWGHVWQTDATGLYSNVGTDLQPMDTVGQTFLRVTDENGYVEFETIARLGDRGRRASGQRGDAHDACSCEGVSRA